uniref:Uncharacterized protein n=1 Tax=Cucumis sativus TaxID=3659 RepID=A0A0A0L736_CUCSA
MNGSFIYNTIIMHPVHCASNSTIPTQSFNVQQQEGATRRAQKLAIAKSCIISCPHCISHLLPLLLSVQHGVNQRRHSNPEQVWGSNGYRTRQRPVRTKFWSQWNQ